MPNWSKIVREGLENCGLRLAQRDEVIRELAAHLEETCQHARARGLDVYTVDVSEFQKAEGGVTCKTAAAICD